jgi:hypothetical protein
MSRYRFIGIRSLYLAILAVFVLLGAGKAGAAARTASVSGNWSDTATWGGSAVPTNGDAVTINAAITVTVDTNANCTSINTLAPTPINNGITIIGTNSLNVSGAISMARSVTASRSTTIAVGGGSLTAGSIALLAQTGASQYTEITISTGSVTVTGNITSAGVSSRITFTGAGTLNVGGSFLTSTAAGTFTRSTGTVNYNAAGAQTVGVYSYNNLTLSGSGAKTMTSVTTIGGNLSVSDSATMTGNAAFTVGGALNYGSSGSSTLTAATPISLGSFNQTAGTLIDNGNTITVTGSGANAWLKSGGTFTATGTAIFTGVAPQIGAVNFNNLSINVGAGRTATLIGSPTVAGDLTVAAGSLDLSTFTADSASPGGTLSVAANAALLLGGAANFPANYSTVALNPSSTVNYNRAGAQTVSAQAYGNLALSGSGAKSVVAGTTVAGRFSIASTGSANADLEDSLNLGVNSLALGGFSQTNGTWGSSASSATHQDDAFFSATTGYLTVTTDARVYSVLTISGNPANYAAPAPLGYGTNSNILEGSWITNSVAATANEANGMRVACSGWGVAYTNGTPITSGLSTQAVFRMRAERLALTWNWTNQYYLSIAANSNGTVSASDWYTNGLQASAQATPDPGSVFLQWTGDVPEGSHTNNPLILTMDRPRAIQAQFSTNTARELKQWTGTGNWTSWANWSPAGMPGPEDDILIKTGAVMVADSTWMQSLIVSNGATVTFTNWNTALWATNVTIQNGGKMTCVGGFMNDAMSNRVAIVCSDMAIHSGGSIALDGKGYAGGTPADARGHGPGGGDIDAVGAGGAGYGGAGSGGNGSSGGSTYGSAEAPLTPGSGGGGCNRLSPPPDPQYGANGGGAVRIQAAGAVVVNGTISANGDKAGNSRVAGGSGGAISITCSTFAGTSGVLRANGGAWRGVDKDQGGAGGGGRISVVYDPIAQAALPKPRVQFSVDRAGGYGGRFSDIGTLYFPDWALMDSGWLVHNGELIVSNSTSWSVPSLIVTNCYIRIPSGNPFVLTVTNNLNIVGPTGILWLVSGAITCGGNMAISGIGSSLYLGGDSVRTNAQTLSCASNMTMAAGARLYVYAALTNAAQPDYGALVDVAGDISIATNAWIYPYSHNTNGGSVFFRSRNLTIATGGGIDATGKGYRGGAVRGPGFGPGKGVGAYSGAGYGGFGGRTGGGTPYGSSNAPVDCGSGAYLYNPSTIPSTTGRGGGSIRIETAGAVTLEGKLTANGNSGNATYGDGGGSGGGIYVTASRFEGTTGSLTADGGAGSTHATDPGGGGGGGRIAVWSQTRVFGGTASVTNGAGYAPAATVGTIVWGQMPASGTLISIW